MSHAKFGPLYSGLSSLLAVCASACITAQDPPVTTLGQDPASAGQDNDSNQGNAKGSDSQASDDSDAGASTGQSDAGTIADAGAGTDCSAEKNAAAQLIGQRCGACHANGQSPGGFGDALDIDAIVGDRLVVLGDLNGSTIYQAVRSGSMPQGGPPFDDAELSTLSDWILCVPTSNGGAGGAVNDPNAGNAGGNGAVGDDNGADDNGGDDTGGDDNSGKGGDD